MANDVPLRAETELKKRDQAREECLCSLSLCSLLARQQCSAEIDRARRQIVENQKPNRASHTETPLSLLAN